MFQGFHSASNSFATVFCQVIALHLLNRCMANCRPCLFSSDTLTSPKECRCNRKTALKEAFSALMLAEPAAVAAAVQRVTQRLRQQEAERKQPLGAKDALALRLNEQYPEVGSAPEDNSSMGVCRRHCTG